MNIGEAARASGVSAKMIRYYESTGLIPAAGRTGAGYRVYSDTEVQMLRFIRRSRDLGFPVEKIQELLALWRDRSRHSADVKRLAQEQIDGLERKIAEMQAMKETLQNLADACCGDHRPDCPILADLGSGPSLMARTDRARSSDQQRSQPEQHRSTD
ncbi:MAG: Cu(I)-responsive transcriptional regulator [Pseudotabrizicola sp.]|uniref:Cu(I)-responsive transcriptional regulator n=1 Tax=Pseudotabrizicola sp. TaxID=2939647 RepID=UPI002731FD6C|nr:Cu(I)-responsive transcriptional regulator [Pseudotabrizicola sp.]MDP2079657.1 Cu(I)-responsive transcriptional regulator [Pseudotabrizicola sp.]MDZ7574580.1 Cu(I)-responsive transcriptional regulator [Pseudotabrizicola sp.]